MFGDYDRWERRNAMMHAEMMERRRREEERFEDENNLQINSLTFDYSAIDDLMKELEEAKKTLKHYISEVIYYPCVNRRDPLIEIKKVGKRWAAVFTFKRTTAQIFTNNTVEFINSKGNRKKVKFDGTGELKDAFINTYGWKE